MFEIGTCNLSCVDRLNFTTDILKESKTFDNIVDFEGKSYCIQLGFLNSNSTCNANTTYSNGLLFDKLKCTKFEPQIIEGLLCYNINENSVFINSDDNIDIFRKDIVFTKHLSYHKNARFLTDSESSNADNEYKPVKRNHDAILSLARDHVKTDRIELNTQFTFDPNSNVKFYQHIIMGGVTVVYRISNHNEIYFEIFVKANGKKYYFMKQKIYELATDIDTYVTLNLIIEYNQKVQMKLNINKSDEDEYTFEDYLFPLSIATLVSDIKVVFKNLEKIQFISNFAQDSVFLASKMPASTPVAIYTKELELLSDENLFINYSAAEDDFLNNYYGITYELGSANTNVTPYQLFLMNNIQKYETDEIDNVFKFKARSLVFDTIALCSQHSFINSNTVSDVVDGVYKVTFSNDESQYISLYKSSFNQINRCYGIKSRFSIIGLDAFKHIEADYLKYSIYGIGLNYDVHLGSKTPIALSNFSNNYGHDIEVTNILPFNQLENYEYHQYESKRLIYITGKFTDLKSKLDLENTVKNIYIYGLVLIIRINQKYYQFSTNANMHVKVINASDDLNIRLLIEY